jgi:hypothetical protein
MFYGYTVTPGGESGPTCSHGIDVRAHVGGDRIGWMARMPCVDTPLSRDVVPCDRAELHTTESLLRFIEDGRKV